MHLPLEEYPVIELTLVWYTALLNNPTAFLTTNSGVLHNHKWPKALRSPKEQKFKILNKKWNLILHSLNFNSIQHCVYCSEF